MASPAAPRPALLALGPHALALLMGQLVHPVPTGTLIAERALETLIGVVVGVAVGLAWSQVARRTRGT